MKSFSPLAFLASLGAGGIAVMPFVIMQYTLPHGSGLITQQAHRALFQGDVSLYYLILELIMIVFSVLHILLTGLFFKRLISWVRTEESKEVYLNPLKNSALLAPFISLLMTMNLFIGPIRYFFPVFSSNFQALMLPAFWVWFTLFVAILWLEIKLLKQSFEKEIDFSKMQFSWLLHPMALGMLSTVGTGIAAMSQNATIANSAGLLSMVSFSMGIFFLFIKGSLLFNKQFLAESLPEKNALPSFLVVIPAVTLFAISAFRFGHYLERTRGFHLDSYFFFVIGLAFAFEVWYLLFGLSLLSRYFKEHHFSEFYLSQWGLICPLVAFVVLGGFAYNVILQNSVFYTLLAGVMFTTILLYIEILYKHVICTKKVEKGVLCE